MILSLLKYRCHPGVSFLHASIRIGYGFASLPLIRKLNIECKLDSDAGAIFDNLEQYLELLKVYGSSYGYTPQPHKCILVTSDRNLSSTKSKFERYEIKVVTWSRYLGGFIGSPNLRSDWLQRKPVFWGEGSEDCWRKILNND